MHCKAFHTRFTLILHLHDFPIIAFLTLRFPKKKKSTFPKKSSKDLEKSSKNTKKAKEAKSLWVGCVTYAKKGCVHDKNYRLKVAL